MVGGTAASTAAAVGIAEPGPIPPDPVTPGVTISSVDNPFDNLGAAHYDTVDAALQSQNNYLSPVGKFSQAKFDEFQYGYLLSNNVFTSAELSADFDSADNAWCVDFTADMPYNPSATPQAKLNTLYAQGKISATVRSVMTDYFNSLSASASLDAFITYSKAAEKLVANSSYTAVDKRTILISMATARYGSAYWN